MRRHITRIATLFYSFYLGNIFFLTVEAFTESNKFIEFEIKGIYETITARRNKVCNISRFYSCLLLILSNYLHAVSYSSFYYRSSTTKTYITYETKNFSSFPVNSPSPSVSEVGDPIG